MKHPVGLLMHLFGKMCMFNVGKERDQREGKDHRCHSWKWEMRNKNTISQKAENWKSMSALPENSEAVTEFLFTRFSVLFQCYPLEFLLYKKALSILKLAEFIGTSSPVLHTYT